MGKNIEYNAYVERHLCFGCEDLGEKSPQVVSVVKE